MSYDNFDTSAHNDEQYMTDIETPNPMHAEYLEMLGHGMRAHAEVGNAGTEHARGLGL